MGSPRRAEARGQNPWEVLDVGPSLGPSSIAVLSLGPGNSLCLCFLTAQRVQD